MANPPKKTGPKPAAKKPVAKPAVKTDMVALTAAQALKAVDQAIGKAPVAPKISAPKPAPAKPAPVVSKAPEAKAVVAAKPAPAPKATPKPVTPTVAKVAAPVAPAPAVAAPVAPAPVVATPAAVKVAPPAPAPVKAATEIKTPEVKTEPKIETKTQEKAAPVAVAPAIPTFAARAEGKIAMNDVIENTKKYTEEAKARFQTAFTDISAKTKAATEKSAKLGEEITDLTKGNVEALVESGKIAAKGLETLGQDAAEYGRTSFEKATATLKSLAAVKSPTEFFQLQSELLSGAFDGFAKEAAKNSEAMLKLAGDVAQPLSSRVAVVTEKVKSFGA